MREGQQLQRSLGLADVAPFLFLFASAIRLYVEPSGPGALRIPGGRYTIGAAAVIGLLTTLSAIVLAVAKVVGMTVFMVVSGVVVYVIALRSGARRTHE